MDLFRKEASRVYVHKVPTGKTDKDGKPEYTECHIDVTYRIPTATEGEPIFVDQLKDTVVFKKFVQEIRSDDIDGWGGGIAPAEVTGLPGTLGLIHSVAMDIVADSRLGFVRKN